MFCANSISALIVLWRSWSLPPNSTSTFILHGLDYGGQASKSPMTKFLAVVRCWLSTMTCIHYPLGADLDLYDFWVYTSLFRHMYWSHHHNLTHSQTHSPPKCARLRLIRKRQCRVRSRNKEHRKFVRIARASRKVATRSYRVVASASSTLLYNSGPKIGLDLVV